MESMESQIASNTRVRRRSPTPQQRHMDSWFTMVHVGPHNTKKHQGCHYWHFGLHQFGVPGFKKTYRFINGETLSNLLPRVMTFSHVISFRMLFPCVPISCRLRITVYNTYGYLWQIVMKCLASCFNSSVLPSVLTCLYPSCQMPQQHATSNLMYTCEPNNIK